jgi:hypothetical protein
MLLTVASALSRFIVWYCRLETAACAGIVTER